MTVASLKVLTLSIFLNCRFCIFSPNMWVKPVCNGWDKGGTLISKFEEKFWDIDIKKITVSHCDHIACTG